MGEYADMMLDGTCCSSCGEFLDIGGDHMLNQHRDKWPAK